MGQPAWRRSFDRVERAVGKPLEDAVASQRYVDAIVLGLKVQLAINRRLRKAVDQQVGAALHLVNLPTRSDVRRLSNQLTTLTGEVRSLAEQADRLSETARELREHEARAAEADEPPDGERDGA